MVAQARHAGGVDQHDPQQADGEAGGADHDVFPARLERLVRALAGHEQRADHGRQLDRDPQDAEVGDDRRGQQRASPNRLSSGQYHAPEPDVADSRDAGSPTEYTATTAYTNATAIRNTPLRPSTKNALPSACRAADDVVAEHNDAVPRRTTRPPPAADSQPLTGRSPTTAPAGRPPAAGRA